ncbi:MAG: hypothetical protein A2Z45_11975 [Chloroflexi bacterium RBG_19FT_COMBO_55_16]|nr:MAG: hypothetical protein A2Z45_11975 [Chloroflexi bacterium RBG_19FT_COMBO_55_16]
MALDFQQIREQVSQLGENAPRREQRLQELRQQACILLESNAHRIEDLRLKVQDVVRSHDPSLRCALPIAEALNAHFRLPELREPITILAADGSQIAPDRHAEVQFSVINVGAVQMCLGSSEPTVTRVMSRLYYDEDLYTATGTITDATLALRRDFHERLMLADLAGHTPPPVITFTDGPMELWGGKVGEGEEASEFRKSLAAYTQVLSNLYELQVTTAGYVDKPGANLVLRLLEVAQTPEEELADIRKRHPLRGVSDFDLFYDLLEVGERSAVFAIQSQSAKSYTGPLALHFFYLNVGRQGHPWLARVEIPAWVAKSPRMLDDLHAVLIHQCRTLGSRPYPYLLHRAHETALVSLQEKEQITTMITLELRRRGVKVGEKSYKQAAKELSSRARYEG